MKRLTQRSKSMTVEAYVACTCPTPDSCAVACGTNIYTLNSRAAENANIAVGFTRTLSG